MRYLQKAGAGILIWLVSYGIFALIMMIAKIDMPYTKAYKEEHPDITLTMGIVRDYVSEDGDASVEGLKMNGYPPVLAEICSFFYNIKLPLFFANYFYWGNALFIAMISGLLSYIVGYGAPIVLVKRKLGVRGGGFLERHIRPRKKEIEDEDPPCYGIITRIVLFCFMVSYCFAFGMVLTYSVLINIIIVLVLGVYNFLVLIIGLTVLNILHAKWKKSEKAKTEHKEE